MCAWRGLTSAELCYVAGAHFVGLCTRSDNRGRKWPQSPNEGPKACLDSARFGARARPKSWFLQPELVRACGPAFRELAWAEHCLTTSGHHPASAPGRLSTGWAWPTRTSPVGPNPGHTPRLRAQHPGTPHGTSPAGGATSPDDPNWLAQAAAKRLSGTRLNSRASGVFFGGEKQNRLRRILCWRRTGSASSTARTAATRTKRRPTTPISNSSGTWAQARKHQPKLSTPSARRLPGRPRLV